MPGNVAIRTFQQGPGQTLVDGGIPETNASIESHLRARSAHSVLYATAAVPDLRAGTHDPERQVPSLVLLRSTTSSTSTCQWNNGMRWYESGLPWDLRLNDGFFDGQWNQTPDVHAMP